MTEFHRHPRAWSAGRLALLTSGLFLLLAAPIWCARAGAWEVEDAAVSAAFAPPHNEPDILKRSSDVARYAFTARGGLRVARRFHLAVQMRIWAMQPWRAASEVGNGLASWSNSDWVGHGAITEWRYGLRVGLTERASVFTESLTISGAIPYYHMVGMEWRWR